MLLDAVTANDVMAPFERIHGSIISNWKIMKLSPNEQKEFSHFISAKEKNNLANGNGNGKAAAAAAVVKTKYQMIRSTSTLICS